MEPYELVESVVSDMVGAFWGVADLDIAVSEEPEAFSFFKGVDRFRFGIVLGAPIPCGAFVDVENAPTPLYMHHYRQLNYILDRNALRIAQLIEEYGYKACCVAASQYVSVFPRPVGHLSHRVLGYYAGLGFIGKSTLLVTPKYGARVRLVTVLTDAPFEPTGPRNSSECGDCRACVDLCPANAIKENSRDFNWKACFEQLRSFRKIPFVGQDICGICVAACPHSGVKRAPEG